MEHLLFCVFLLFLFILCLIQIVILIHLPDLPRQGEPFSATRVRFPEGLSGPFHTKSACTKPAKLKVSCRLGSLKCTCIRGFRNLPSGNKWPYTYAEFLPAFLWECKQRQSLPWHYLPMSLLVLVLFCTDAWNPASRVTFLVSFCTAWISAKIMLCDFSIPSVLAPHSKGSSSCFLNHFVSFKVLTFSILPLSGILPALTRTQ